MYLHDAWWLQTGVCDTCYYSQKRKVEGEFKGFVPIDDAWWLQTGVNFTMLLQGKKFLKKKKRIIRTYIFKLAKIIGDD